jgi:NAD+ synthase (glutamine-hydrolysing)
VNCVGAQDHILFDGRSFLMGADGNILKQARSFEEDSLMVSIDSSIDFSIEKSKKHAPNLRNDWQDLRQGLACGIHDYVKKIGAQKVLLGLSGGIDSALVATLATDALGPENVLGIMLPSRFNSTESLEQAQSLAKNLRIKTQELPITNTLEAAVKTTGINESGLTHQNIQSRIRGLLLMALSNETNALLLSTGNKSELAMGYTTLYGDMNGALMPIGDLYKTEVYGLSHYINFIKTQQGLAPPIPQFTLSRAPSAELAPNQKDTDSLPDYEILDVVLRHLIENQGQFKGTEKNWNDFLRNKHTIAALKKQMHRQEFKRKQAPPILRVHQRSFAAGWNMPLAKGDL